MLCKKLFSIKYDEYDDHDGDHRADRIRDPSDLTDLLFVHRLITARLQLAVALRTFRHVVEHRESAMRTCHRMLFEIAALVFHILIIP